MRFVTMLTVGVLLSSALGAAAQTAPPATGGTNANTVTGGSSSNTNANSNSQFLSGSNTGVNNGLLEIYAGADPYQGIIFGDSTNLPQLPGILSPPSNFSQPYRPDAFVNTPPFLPAEITLEDAKRCRDAKGTWYGGSRDGEPSTIRLFYTAKREPVALAPTMANYVGTAMATIADGPFLAALCEAAYRALRKGATVGLVEFNIRPKNTMMGVGFGTSGGATGLPAAGAHPYAIAGTLGFGTGWSNQRVEGEVVLQLTGLHGVPIASTDPSAVSPAAATGTPSSGDDGATPGPGAAVSDDPPVAGARVVLGGAQAPVIHAPQPARPTPQPPPDRRPDPLPAAPHPGEPPAPATLEPAAAAITQPVAATPIVEPAATTVTAPLAAAATTQPAVTAAGSGGAAPPGRAYHSARRLVGLRAGQSKDEVFGRFGSQFATRGQRVVEIEGMRLRASGQPAGRAYLEVGEVSLADEAGRTVLYWFLFSDGRLVAWGRPEQWDAAATKYGVDLPYRPTPLRVEAKVDLASGR
jgi:hypothetical protein